MFTNRHSWSVGMYPIAACPILAPASKIVNPSNTPYGAWFLLLSRHWLDLDLDALPLEPLEHPLVLLRRREARPHRLPRPTRANPTILRLVDADQRGLRRRVHRVVVRLEPPLDRMHVFLL